MLSEKSSVIKSPKKFKVDNECINKEKAINTVNELEAYSQIENIYPQACNKV